MYSLRFQFALNKVNCRRSKKLYNQEVYKSEALNVASALFSVPPDIQFIPETVFSQKPLLKQGKILSNLRTYYELLSNPQTSNLSVLQSNLIHILVIML